MKISVITPFYKGNDYLPAYFDHITQNAHNLRSGDECEVIIVNDSPQVSVRLPEGARGLDLRIIDLPENGGIHNARVQGLSHSSGDWVMFLDQDDILAENALRRLSDSLREAAQAGMAGHGAMSTAGGAIDIVISNAILEQREGREFWYRTDYHKKLIWDLRTYLNVGTQIMSPGQALIRRSAIPGEWCRNILRHNCCDDYYLWLLMLGQGSRALYVDEPLYIHRFTGENASSDARETYESTLEMIGALRLSRESTNDAPRSDSHDTPNDAPGCDSHDAPRISPADIHTLRRMTDYKFAFRGAGRAGKLILSMGHPALAVCNIVYKLRTRTPLGFNR